MQSHKTLGVSMPSPARYDFERILGTKVDAVKCRHTGFVMTSQI